MGVVVLTIGLKVKPNLIRVTISCIEAVRWSAVQECKIRRVLSSEGLKLKISPDLAARLSQDDDKDHLIFVEKSIQEMVTLIKGSGSSKSRERVEKDLAGILDGNAPRDVVDVCGRVLLQEFKASINSRNIWTLKQLFKLIQHCNRGILEAALKAFCENTEFVRLIKGWNNGLETSEAVFDIVVWFMKATGEGKILISRASRVSLLTTWLPIMGSFTKHRSLTCKFWQLDNAVLKVVESLPQVDQKRICLLWAQVYSKNEIDIATPFTLSKSLQAK
ncbi:hypothetical protein SUGI_0295670 [Cryptomeria japonica]|nr:hypothetical protein SUGI_0295670 [Cryptomeria japonica]